MSDNPEDWGPIRRRSTTDLLILLIAFTICFAVLAAGGTIAVIEIKHPSTDTSTAYKSVQDVINTLIGLLAGFLAGRTESTRENTIRERRVERRARAAEEDEVVEEE